MCSERSEDIGGRMGEIIKYDVVMVGGLSLSIADGSESDGAVGSFVEEGVNSCQGLF